MSIRANSLKPSEINDDSITSNEEILNRKGSIDIGIGISPSKGRNDKATVKTSIGDKERKLLASKDLAMINFNLKPLNLSLVEDQNYPLTSSSEGSDDSMTESYEIQLDKIGDESPKKSSLYDSPSP